MKVLHAPFPADSWLQSVSPADYDDTFTLEWPSEHRFPSEEMLIALFCRTPAWLNALYGLRNAFVRLFRIAPAVDPAGRATPDEGHPAKQLARAIRERRPCGPFTLPHQTLDETVLLGKERHLDFYLAVQAASNNTGRQRMTATTLVKYNNTAGRVYFFFVRPFHRLVVPAMMRGAARALEKDGGVWKE